MGKAMTGSQPWPAPAKLNRFLHITGRRADGMHELQTLFQFLDYGDALTFELLDDSRIMHRTPLAGVDPGEDLTIRAARLLQKAAECPRGAAIHIDKRLPMGGGLGGGSSDCATTLVALNRLWGLDWALERLAELGLQLGADVPVFVRGEAAWAEGVGEVLTAVDLDEPWFLVIRPDCEVSTGQVFNAPDLTRSTPPMTIRGFLDGAGHNDCEPVVRALFPPVGEALDWLNERATAWLTGTGACIFAAFATHAAAANVAAALPRRWQGFVARGLNQSPLRQRLQQEIS